MKVAILSPHLRNAGGTKILFSYANGLERKGHQVTIFVKSKNILRRSVANWLGLGKPNWMECKFKVCRIGDWSDTDFSNYDHVIAGGYKEATFLSSNDLYAKKWYVVQHDEGLYHGNRVEVDRVLTSDLNKIAVSSWLKEIVDSKSKTPAQLLLNPYDRSQFYKSKTKAHEEIIKILILDHVFPWKGTDEAIDLVSKIKNKFSNIKLVGLGRRRDVIDGTYDEYHFDPPQDKLREIYSDADIFLCMSWDEGFGLPSLEAMVCGAAVVTYDNGGSRDFAIDEKTAFVAPRKDMETIESKLVEAIGDTEKRKRIAKAGREFVESMSTWEEQIMKLERILINK